MSGISAGAAESATASPMPSRNAAPTRNGTVISSAMSSAAMLAPITARNRCARTMSGGRALRSAIVPAITPNNANGSVPAAATSVTVDADVVRLAAINGMAALRTPSPVLDTHAAPRRRRNDRGSAGWMRRCAPISQ